MRALIAIAILIPTLAFGQYDWFQDMQRRQLEQRLEIQRQDQQRQQEEMLRRQREMQDSQEQFQNEQRRRWNEENE